jgi:hypothetical protein
MARLKLFAITQAALLTAGPLVAQVAEPRPAPVQKVEWKDGKTRFTLGDSFYLELGSKVQFRYTHELPDDAVQLPGTAAPGDDKGSFRIRRAKLKLEGFVYKPALEFELQLNWPDVNNTPPGQFLEDANLDLDVSGRKKLRVKLGQFKAPFGRQQLTSSTAQQFVDRAIQDARYNDARETGVALWGTLGGHEIDWRVMLSNGNGKTQPANDNDAFLVSGRVMWQALGKARMNQWGSGPLLTEGDLGDSKNGALLAVAAQVSSNDRFDATPATDLKNRTYAIDYTFKYRGFASVAEGAWRESRPETGPSFKDRGFLVQASYAWKAPGIAGASFWEVAFRFAQVDPSDIVEDNDRREIGGAFSYYYNRHNLKVQADFRNLRDEAANSGNGTSSNELRVQTQISF